MQKALDLAEAQLARSEENTENVSAVTPPPHEMSPHHDTENVTAVTPPPHEMSPPHGTENVTAATPLPETAAQKRADALGLLAQSALGRSGFLARGSGQAADHLQVVLHVDAEALTHPDQQGCSAASAHPGVAGTCCFEHGPAHLVNDGPAALLRQ